MLFLRGELILLYSLPVDYCSYCPAAPIGYVRSDKSVFSDIGHSHIPCKAMNVDTYGCSVFRAIALSQECSNHPGQHIAGAAVAMPGLPVELK